MISVCVECGLLHVSDGGSTDPAANFLLARAFEEGKSKDVPMKTMENILSKLVSTATMQ